MFLTFILVLLPHLHCADTFIIKGTKCSLSLFVKLCWPDFLSRADLSQGHWSFHNQATGHQNHHGPHSCHEGPYPHRGRPLLWRWVSVLSVLNGLPTSWAQHSQGSVPGVWPRACWGGMFQLVQQQRRRAVALAYWLMRHWMSRALFGDKVRHRGAFCKCKSQWGRVLSALLSQAMPTGFALTQIPQTGLCLIRETHGWEHELHQQRTFGYEQATGDLMCILGGLVWI